MCGHVAQTQGGFQRSLSSPPFFSSFVLRTLGRTSDRQLGLALYRPLGTKLMGANAAGIAAKTSVVFSLLAHEEILTPLAPLDPRSFWIIADLRVSIKKLHEIVDGSSLKNVPEITRRVIAPCRSDPEGIHVRGHLLFVATRLTVTR